MLKLLSYAFAMPLMLIPMLAYGGVRQSNFVYDIVFQWSLPSGGLTSITGGMCIIMLGMICLLFEIWKSTSTGARSIVDLILSMLLFVAGIVVYVLWPYFGTATFLALLLLQGLDVMAGAVVMIVGARRDFGVSGGVL